MATTGSAAGPRILIVEDDPTLAENLYLPVAAVDMAQVADFESIPELRSPERQAQGLLAIGAALRSAA